MNQAPRSSPLYALHVVLAVGTGVLITACAVLLFFDLRYDTVPTCLVATLLAALAVGAVHYLNRAALLARRAWIALVAVVPGVFGALFAWLAISLALHPIGF